MIRAQKLAESNPYGTCEECLRRPAGRRLDVAGMAVKVCIECFTSVARVCAGLVTSRDDITQAKLVRVDVDDDGRIDLSKVWSEP